MEAVTRNQGEINRNLSYLRRKQATYGTLIYNKLFDNRIPTSFLAILTAKSDRRFGRLKTLLAKPNDLLKTTRF